MASTFRNRSKTRYRFMRSSIVSRSARLFQDGPHSGFSPNIALCEERHVTANRLGQLQDAADLLSDDANAAHLDGYPALDPKPPARRARRLPAQTCSLFCPSSRHLLRSWSLGQTRRGSCVHSASKLFNGLTTPKVSVESFLSSAGRSTNSSTT